MILEVLHLLNPNQIVTKQAKLDFFSLNAKQKYNAKKTLRYLGNGRSFSPNVLRRNLDRNTLIMSVELT